MFGNLLNFRDIRKAELSCLGREGIGSERRREVDDNNKEEVVKALPKLINGNSAELNQTDV